MVKTDRVTASEAWCQWHGFTSLPFMGPRKKPGITQERKFNHQKKTQSVAAVILMILCTYVCMYPSGKGPAYYGPIR